MNIYGKNPSSIATILDKKGFLSKKSYVSLGAGDWLQVINIYLVMQALGHADVKTTQIYLDFPEGFLKDVFSDWIPDVNKKMQNIKETGAKT